MLGAQASQNRFEQLHRAVEVTLVAGDDAKALHGASGDAFVAGLLCQRQTLLEVQVGRGEVTLLAGDPSRSALGFGAYRRCRDRAGCERLF